MALATRVQTINRNTASVPREDSQLLGRGCSSYLLGANIQGFGTALGARDEFLTFAFSAVPFRAVWKEFEAVTFNFISKN